MEQIYQLVGPDGFKGLVLIMLLIVVWSIGPAADDPANGDSWDATLKDANGKFPRSPSE